MSRSRDALANNSQHFCEMRCDNNIAENLLNVGALETIGTIGTARADLVGLQTERRRGKLECVAIGDGLA